MKVKLVFLGIIISVSFVNAQIYTPSGTIHGTSGNNNIGIGTNTPSHLLNVYGTHGDSRILLHSNGGGYDVNQADLMLWASEPGLTYTGVGIGNNIHNFNTINGGLHLLNPARGGSYIRLLDATMSFNVVTSGAVDKQALTINNIGNIGIGITNPNNKLDVNGTIHSKEVKVDMIGWSDFVFKKEYELPTLEEIEKHIKENGHLENIPSEKEVVKNGINLGEMNVKLLQKIEELTLYIIEQNKRIKKLERKINN